MQRHIRNSGLGLGFLLASVALFQSPAQAQDAAPQGSGRAVVTKVEPAYPQLARQYHLSGKVRIEVVVSPNGHVKDAKVLGGSPLLASAAMVAAKECKYESGPKETVETIDFIFH